MKDLGVLMVKKLSMSQLHPGLHQKSAAGQSREVTPRLYSYETPPVYCVQVWEPQHKKDMDLLKGHKSDQRTGALPIRGQAKRVEVV